jgi:tetratricopeptide (TPR) repeat protein
VEDGKPFRFNLYRIPFNGGSGGKAEPVRGASYNGLSNYFPKFSPDGRWIVFCRARSYMLLQPDADLYIIPAEGGEARRLRCNTPRMNSWHSWSPNGRWLVFASKANGPYTRMWLAHMDAEGRSSPPVVLAHMTAPDRAVNIPEFVNVPGDAIAVIREKFLDDYSFVRAGNEFFRHGEADNAIAEYRNALELNPDNFTAHLRLGFLLYHVKSEYAQGMAHYRKALSLEPKDPRIQHDVGMALMHQRRFDAAAAHLGRALEGMPEVVDPQYGRATTAHHLGRALYLAGKPEQAVPHLREAVRLEGDRADVHYTLALAQAGSGDVARALKAYARAVALDADLAGRPTFPHALAAAYAKGGRFREALAEARKALDLARRSGRTDLVRQIEADIRVLAERARRPPASPQP